MPSHYDLRSILLVVAFILFLLAAIGVPAGRVSLVAMGLTCWVLSVLLSGVRF